MATREEDKGQENPSSLESNEIEEPTVTVRTLSNRILVSGNPASEVSVKEKVSSERNLSLVSGLRLIREIRQRLKSLNYVSLTLDGFAKSLECIRIKGFLQAQSIRDLDHFLSSFFRVIKEENEFAKRFGFRVRGICYQDEIALLQHGFMSMKMPALLSESSRFTISSLEILDTQEFERRHKLTTDASIDYDILNTPSFRLGSVEKHWENGVVLYVSRRLTDSVRYFQYRMKNGPTRLAASHPENFEQQLFQKMASVFIHLLVRARFSFPDAHTRFVLNEYRLARDQLPRKVLDHLQRQVSCRWSTDERGPHETLATEEEKLREEIVLLSEDPNYWHFPGIGPLLQGSR